MCNSFSENKSAEVICVGMATVDILARNIDSMPEPGTTLFVDSISLSTGGDAMNQAITLSKLGVNVSLSAVVGNDIFGDYALNECLKYGIDTQGVFVDNSEPTSTTIVPVASDGERSFIGRRNALISKQGIDHVDLNLVKEGTKVVSVGSLFCSKELDLQVLPKLLKRAKQVGAITIADLISDRIDGTLREMSPVLSHLDYIVPSLDEAVQFTGQREPLAAARVFLEYGVKNVIVKLGSAGALAISHDHPEPIVVPVFSTDVVDTTGSGDNFMAGLITGLLEGKNLKEAMIFGSAVAALSVQAVGASLGVKSRSQVMAFMDSHKAILEIP